MVIKNGRELNKQFLLQEERINIIRISKKNLP